VVKGDAGPVTVGHAELPTFRVVPQQLNWNPVARLNGDDGERLTTPSASQTVFHKYHISTGIPRMTSRRGPSSAMFMITFGFAIVSSEFGVFQALAKPSGQRRILLP
jgi:hypothetical protein